MIKKLIILLILTDIGSANYNMTVPNVYSLLDYTNISQNNTIAFENLNIKNMQQNSHLAKSIADVSWGMMVRITKNKAVEAGSKVILVDPKNTTQLCSRCGQYVRKELSDRIHSCPSCGLVMDRDQNAAINILRLGLQSLAVKTA